MFQILRIAAPLTLAACLLLLPAGCPKEIEDVNIEVDRNAPVIIENPPPDIGVEEDVLLPEATVITDVAVIPVEVVPDVTVLTFENLTDVDMAISYFVNDQPQTVLVLFGTAVSIEYQPCLATVQLDLEDDFDPATGLYLDTFDLSDIFLEEGFEFFCGDEIFFTFDPATVTATVAPL